MVPLPPFFNKCNGKNEEEEKSNTGLIGMNVCVKQIHFSKPGGIFCDVLLVHAARAKDPDVPSGSAEKLSNICKPV